MDREQRRLGEAKTTRKEKLDDSPGIAEAASAPLLKRKRQSEDDGKQVSREKSVEFVSSTTKPFGRKDKHESADVSTRAIRIDSESPVGSTLQQPPQAPMGTDVDQDEIWLEQCFLKFWACGGYGGGNQERDFARFKAAAQGLEAREIAELPDVIMTAEGQLHSQTTELLDIQKVQAKAIDHFGHFQRYLSGEDADDIKGYLMVFRVAGVDPALVKQSVEEGLKIFDELRERVGRSQASFDECFALLGPGDEKKKSSLLEAKKMVEAKLENLTAGQASMRETMRDAGLA